ncbi:ABC transporter ATP-binding protein [Azotobacter vinelandii]|uniref:ABC transporter ATP-binding protein n=1 Tax=Azotobacter vinelandii TaxID=354 RepID=UPI002665D313|nr:ABC transporter ATP-binding protein [Azotobacter vinelandii]WKN22507.1 ABC transporter ATP-binding protein [Azotobacter vinelandii]
MGGVPHRVLHEVSLSIERGQSCAIVGASGSGKSTLLNILGLLDQPASGRFLLDGLDMSRATADERAGIRNQCIGFVFQNFNLLPRLNALDNVALPLLYRGYHRTEARQHARRQLERVGLAERTAHRPADLSGGQRQRVAIARALVGKPSLILADEPTGNLDSATAQDIVDLLLQLNRQEGVTLVMVTHDDGLARRLDRCLHVKDGSVVEMARHRTASHA